MAHISADFPERSERPTRVRYCVVAVTVLMAVILYLDRFCVSFAERYIKEDLAMTEREVAVFISLFFWSYALGQVPAGWLGDRFGARGVLSFYILTWSLFTALIGVAGGIASLMVMRLGCGLAQAGAYPAAGALLRRWVPFSSRGVASALVALGGRVGAVIAPVLTAYLMVMFVPLSTSALFQPAQILAPVKLCARLGPPVTDESASSDAVAQRVRALWPEATRGELDARAAECRRLLVSKGPPESDPTLPAFLSNGLNGALQRPDLYDEASFSGLRNIDREALHLLAERNRGRSLSDAELQRLNRLLIEAAFPSEVGKLYVRGWRPVLVTYGIAGLLVAAAFWIVFRNSPAGHSRCNAAERELIAGDPFGAPAPEPAAPAPQRVEPEALPVKAILRSPSLWLSSISQFGTNIGWLFLVTFLPRYLVEVHHVPILERSWMALVPPLAGIAGMFLGGRLTDSLTRRIGLRWGRAIPMGATRFFGAAAYIACLWIDSPWIATMAFACVFFFVDLGVSAVWAFMQDVGGKHVGSILGWGNMWGNIGAAIAPLLYDAVLGKEPTLRDWNIMFLVCAGMFVIGGFAALGIDARVPIQGTDRAAAPKN